MCGDNAEYAVKDEVHAAAKMVACGWMVRESDAKLVCKNCLL